MLEEPIAIVNVLGGGHTSTARHTSSPIEIVFPARRQESTSPSIEPRSVDGKALQGESFFPSHAEEKSPPCDASPVCP